MSLEGQQLGRYRLLRLLGSGGMGEVYLAEDARIAQQVAIKVIRAEGVAYPQSETAKEAARLFEREARAIARLDHPNILPLYAYGEETLHDTPLTYLVMPYRKEGTLANWLRQRGSTAWLTPAEVAPLVQQAADALQHAHDQQVIHQDIKPTNFLIRLRPDHPNCPDLLLADFGIAKLTSATASASQSIRGTPTYMAPEQWEGHPVPATDQYALAIMVYELLVGRPPFQGGPGQVMRQHYLTPPPAPSTLNPRLSAAMDAVLLRALSKQPGERFPSVAAFARAFQEAVQSDGELHATLAINRAEAQTGTTRRLTLPGGRQVSVSVPAGVGDGTTLRLEGQGMPYYEGGPAGPLLLTISIPAAERPLPPQQGSTQPTAPGLAPHLQTPSVEDARVPTAHADAPAVLEPTVPAPPPRDNMLAPTALAASTPSLPTEVAPPTREPSFPTEVARASTPPALRPGAMVAVKPAKPGASRRFVLLGLAGLVIVALASGIAWFTFHQAAPVPTSPSSPWGITAGPDGNLWFTEAAGNKIGRISPSGTITQFPLPTSDSWPDGITAGPDGNLWFTEFDGHKIGRISPSGTISEFPLPTSGSKPRSITAGPDGNLWFTDTPGDKIGRISPSGMISEFPLASKGGPWGITAGPDGNLWFTEMIGDKIGRISPSGTISEFPLPTSSFPEGITAGPDGNLWFTEYESKIGRISPSGTITQFPLPTSGSESGGITAGPDGNLWFTEQYGKIGRISPSGK